MHHSQSVLFAALVELSIKAIAPCFKLSNFLESSSRAEPTKEYTDGMILTTSKNELQNHPVSNEKKAIFVP